MHGTTRVVLGIESSCDETAVAVVSYSAGTYEIRSNVVYSQIATHAKTGGVVPEIAAREHCVMILPAVERALADAKMSTKQLDAIAVTAGPGLITSLSIGVEAARELAWLWNKPLLPINHIEGHVASTWLTEPGIRFPALCLVVSGGHTELLLMERLGKYRCIGRTLDDAAGEAFDKVAKVLRLGYPGGPAVSKLAASGDPKRYDLPRPMLDRKNFDFSFAGIKTSVLYLVEGVPGNKKFPPQKIKKADLAASFQQAVVDVLVTKTIRAARQYSVKTVLLAGGVSANSALRQQLGLAVTKELPKTAYVQPAIKFCGDNGAMIAVRGLQLLSQKRSWLWQEVTADPNWELW